MKKQNETHGLKKRCFKGVSNTLQVIGVDRQVAIETVYAHKKWITVIAQNTKSLDHQLRDKITTLVLLEMMINRTYRAHYSLYHNRNDVIASLKSALRDNEHWRYVALSYSKAMEQVVSDKAPSENELIALFEPSEGCSNNNQHNIQLTRECENEHLKTTLY